MLLCCWALPAFAHGRFPQSYQLVRSPTDRSDLAIVTTFGMVLSDDGGATWRWLCRDAAGIGPSEDPRFVITGDGRFLGGTFRGLIEGTRDGCAWSSAGDAFDNRFVIDVASDPQVPGRHYAVTSSGGERNDLFRSDDDGTTWQALPGGERILYERVLIAPSDPSRIYLSAIHPRTVAEPERRAVVFRSDDGGQSWMQFAFAFEDEERAVVLASVSPGNPDHLLMRVLADYDVPTQYDRLVRSEDGGETWETVLRVADLQDATFSPDGTEAWAAGRAVGIPAELIVDGGPPPEEPPKGLWHSSDAGRTFEHQRQELSLGCVQHYDGELWVCAENYADGFSVGRSADGGESFETVFRFQDFVGPVQCDDGGATAATCATQDHDIIVDLQLPLDAGTFCADGGVCPDGGMQSPGSGGCQCSTSHLNPVSCVPFLLLFLLRRRR